MGNSAQSRIEKLNLVKQPGKEDISGKFTGRMILNFKTMKYILRLLFLLLVTTLWNVVYSQSDLTENNKLIKVWETPPVLITSESVCYDSDRNILYVSCINGNPVDKDNSGFIAKVDLQGNVIDDKWVTGLDAPKGMGIYKGKLYVTDIDNVVEIDIPTGKITKKYTVDGAKFLNDIAIGPQGSVYISDMATNKIIVIGKDKVAETFVDAKAIKNPNGLLIEGEKLLVGTDDGIYRIRLDNGRHLRIISIEGGIDGLKSDGEGNYIISDWKGKVQLVNPDNKPVILFDTSDLGINAADLEYIPSEKLLLIPTFGDNRVSAFRFEE